MRSKLARIAARQARLAPLIEGVCTDLDAGDAERAIERFDAAGEDRERLARVLENGLNDLGYRHLRAGRLPEAHAVFARNVELFPRSSNAWDSLGEALWKLDRDDEAVAAYEHVLELDPDASGAQQSIERILAEQ